MRHTPSLDIGPEALIAVVSKFTMAIVSFGAVVVFAWKLGPEGLGVYRTVLAAAFIAAEVPAGVGTAIQKRVSEVDVSPPAFLGVGLAVHAGFSVLLLLAFVVAAPVATAYFTSPQLAYGVVGVVASMGVFIIFNRLVSGLGYPGLSSWMDTARTWLAVAIQLVLLLVLEWEAFGLVVGFALGALLTGFGSAAVARSKTATIGVARPTAVAAERVFSFARWSVPNGLLDSIYKSADVLFLKALVGTGPVGFYTVAMQLSMPATFLSGSISDALEVKASGLSSVGSEVRADLVNAVAYAGLLSIPIFFGALAMPKALVVTVFGPRFADAWPALVGLSLYQVFNVYRTPFEAVVKGTDRPATTTRINLATLVLYLPAVAVLGSLYGLVGVVAATVLSEGIRFGTYQFVARAEFGGLVLPRPLLEQVAAGAVMFAAVWSVNGTLVSVTSWQWLLVLVGFGAAVYFGVLLAISWHFRFTLRGTIESVRQ